MESFGLIVAECLWGEAIEVAVVGIVGSTSLEPVHLSTILLNIDESG